MFCWLVSILRRLGLFPGDPDTAAEVEEEDKLKMLVGREAAEESKLMPGSFPGGRA